MTDEENVAELKRQFLEDDEYLVGEVLADYDNGDLDQRLIIVRSLFSWSRSEPCAWDTLLELCRRPFDRVTPFRLIEFARLAAIGEHPRPGRGPGAPIGDVNEKICIVSAVSGLIKRGYKKTPACKLVSEWCNEPNGKRSPRTPGAIRKIVARGALKAGHK